MNLNLHVLGRTVDLIIRIWNLFLFFKYIPISFNTELILLKFIDPELLLGVPTHMIEILVLLNPSIIFDEGINVFLIIESDKILFTPGSLITLVPLFKLDIFFLIYLCRILCIHFLKKADVTKPTYPSPKMLIFIILT